MMFYFVVVAVVSVGNAKRYPSPVCQPVAKRRVVHRAALSISLPWKFDVHLTAGRVTQSLYIG